MKTVTTLKILLYCLIVHCQCIHCFQGQSLFQIERRGFSDSPTILGGEFKFRLDSNDKKRIDLLEAPLVAVSRNGSSQEPQRSNRREILSKGLIGIVLLGNGSNMRAEAEDLQVTEEELDSLYDNPEMPKAPEERSGLVVLRVAEVAQFQEKILRAVASGEMEGVKVSPMQFTFGTQVLLKNSNLDGNIKLMISQEIPRDKQQESRKYAASCMNELQEIIKYTAAIQRDFEKQEMINLADMYLSLRVNLNQLYEYLPAKEKEKYYGYFAAVTEYEKKVAGGVYNPDIDGVLKFD